MIRGVRRLVILAFIWGWSFLFIKVAVEGMSPTTVAWGRITLGAAVLFVVLRRQGGQVPRDRVMLRHFALTAVAGTMLPFSLLAWAEQDITSALTAVLNGSTPLFTALFSALALSERLRPLQLAGLAVGITGVALAVDLGTSDLHGSSLTGALAAVGAGCCYGIAFVYIKRNLTGVPPLVAATGQLTAGAILLAPVALATSIIEGISLTPSRVAAVALLGVVGTGIAFALNYRVIGELGATRASLVTYLVPVVAVIVGVVVLSEPFEWRLVVGAALTICGIAAVTYGRVARSPAASSPASREPVVVPQGRGIVDAPAGPANR